MIGPAAAPPVPARSGPPLFSKARSSRATLPMIKRHKDSARIVLASRRRYSTKSLGGIDIGPILRAVQVARSAPQAMVYAARCSKRPAYLLRTACYMPSVTC